MTDSDSSPVEVDSKGDPIHSRKKFKKKSFLQQQHSRSHGSGSTLSEITDLNSVVLVSSAKCVTDVTSRFDSTKKSLVESIGFGGLLHLPSIPSKNISFSLWLLRCLKWGSGSLCVGDKINLTLCNEHIGKITGLNHSGIDVLEKPIESPGDKLSFINSRLSFLHTQSDIVQAAQSFIDEPTPKPISQEYVNNFKVAFVIFVMGRFLAPGENFIDGNHDYWRALEHPEAINCYNWCSYILSSILDSARVLIWDIVYKRKISPILCCTFILELFYLDNVDFGTYNLPHSVFPRVKHYSFETISAMIESDRCLDIESNSVPTYGRIQMVRSSGVCYVLARQPAATTSPPGFPNLNVYPPPSPSFPPVHSKKRSIQHSTEQNNSSSKQLPIIPYIDPSFDTDLIDVASFVKDNYSGKVPADVLEVIDLHQARSLCIVDKFSSGLKAALSKENANLVSRLCGYFKRTDDESISGPFSEGVPRSKIHRTSPRDVLIGSKSSSAANICHTDRYQDSPSPCGTKYHMSRNQNTAGSSSRQANSVFNFSDNWSKKKQSTDSRHNFHTPEASLKFYQSPPLSPTTESKAFNGTCLSARQAFSMSSLDLNARSFAAEYSSSPIVKTTVQIGPLAKSHWELGSHDAIPQSASISSFFHWLLTDQSIQDRDRTWIMHDFPRFIEVQGVHLRDGFVNNHLMSFQVFDIAVRRIKQMDRPLYATTTPLRWRHFFESDFSLHIIGQDKPVENIAVREQFIGHEVDYEICRCRMFFVPVLVNELWWLYVFDVKTKKIVIMDLTLVGTSTEHVAKKHFGTIDLIKQKLDESVALLFSGWKPQFSEFKASLFRYAGMPLMRSQSAIFTLFCMCYFDGDTLSVEATQNNLQKFKEYLLYEVVAINGNSAPTPNAHVQVIE